jgi:hypothetical protein
MSRIKAAMCDPFSHRKAVGQHSRDRTGGCDAIARGTVYPAVRPSLRVEVSALMGFSRQTVTRLFENEPGVIILDRPTTMSKQRYRSIRIPRAVYERVVARLRVK